jgi:hypothetical protein
MNDQGLFSRDIIQRYLPDVSAFAGCRRYVFTDGKQKGMEAIDVATGSGFELTVLPDRGLDIAGARYKGIPVAFVSKGGLFPPAFFQNGKMEYLKVFYGGLLTTCGLTQAGTPCTDQDPILGEVDLGLHGRVNCIPAEKVSVREYWEGEEYCIEVAGSVRQSELYAENILLERRIRTRSSRTCLIIEDRVRNEGGRSEPFMLLYHINFGYPFVSPDSRLLSTYAEVSPINDFARKRGGPHDRFGEPDPGYLPDNFLFSKPAKARSVAALLNEKIHLAAYISFDPVSLPYLTEWVQLSQQDYVVGLEPGNCRPEGRAEARRNNRLDHLEPGEERSFSVEVGVAEEEMIRGMLGAGQGGTHGNR